MKGRWWRAAKAVGAAGLTVAVAACRDQSTPTQARNGAEQPARMSVVGVNDAWDTFGVDVEITTTRLDATGKEPLRQYPVFYHLQRQITTGGTWNMVLNFGSRSKQAMTGTTGNFPPENWEVARFEDDGDGSPPRMYDGLGREISTQIPAGLTSSAATPRAGWPAVRPVSPASNRTWAGAFVLTASGASTRSVALVRQFGLARRTAAGLDEYSAHHDSVDVTVDADPATVGIRSMVERANGAMLRRWTNTYETQPDGSVVKREARVETPAGHGNKWGRITVTTFSNLQFGRRAGA